MPRLRASVVLVGLAFAASATRAEGEDFVAAALGRAIIGPRQALAEVADYTESSIPRMPRVTTLAEWQAYDRQVRSETLERVVFRGQAAAWRDARTGVEWLETIEAGPGYRIKKLRYEALPGLWIPALLYEPEPLTGRIPIVLNVNGHDAKGKAADYKQIRCINQAKRGMLALNIEWLGMGQLRDPSYRHDLINHIDLCGAAGIATHYLAMSRGLDLLLALEHADPERLAVTGLSGGGWQTIFISALDTRVKLTDPVAGYSSFRTRVRYFADLGDSEQTPCDLATVADYAQLTAMMAPRPTLLTFNLKDNCCFASDHALPPLLEAARPIFALFGKPENLRWHVNEDPGTHNYLLDNRQALYRMLGDHFFAGRSDCDPQEIPSDAEVKTPEALDVKLPAGNASLHSLALDLSRSLPLSAELPRDRTSAASWRDARRSRLATLVRARRYETRAEQVASEEAEGVSASFWKLVSGGWSIPVVEFARGDSRGAVLVVADAGRKGAEALVRQQLDQGKRVFAVDPFYIGEARVADKDYLFALLLAAVGDRPLGLQASELAAVARWARDQRGVTALTLIADGPRTGTMALVAAGLEDLAIDGLELHHPQGSLKELIESKAAYSAAPELYCFGLLREFDIAQLAALAAPRPLVLVDPNQRAREELAGLKDWYATWGITLDPLAGAAGSAAKP
jgi:hypothetical protein